MSSDNTPETAKRNWAFIFSPYFIVAILFAGLYIFTPLSADYEFPKFLLLLLMYSVPATVIMLAIDIFLKAILNNSRRKTMYIWTIELILAGLVFIAFSGFHG